MIGAEYRGVTIRTKTRHEIREIEKAEDRKEHQKKTECGGEWAAPLRPNEPQAKEQNQGGNGKKILPPDSLTDVPDRINDHQIFRPEEFDQIKPK